MKRFGFIVVLFIFTCAILDAGLLEMYRKGKIILAPDPTFAAGVDWDSLFYDVYKELELAPGGELFVANCRQDNVFIFSKSGHFVKQFGQRGEGPGDLYSIGNLGILDEKHLLVSEAPQRKRLSLFGLDGQFRKVVKTKYPVYHAVALKNNKIAYLTYSWETSGNNGGKRKQKNRIILKDLDSNRERILQSVSLVEKRVIKDSSRSGIYLKNFVGNVFIRRSKEGNLLVGVSNSPELVIYSPEGKRLKSIRLTLPRRKVQDAYIQRYKKMQIQSMEADPFYSRNKRLINFVKGYPFEKVFDEYLPFYHEILVDSLGNFLVFKWPKKFEDYNEVFQVYTGEGTFVCETEIDEGKFDLFVDCRFKTVIFSEQGIFSLVQVRNSEDESPRLIRVNVR